MSIIEIENKIENLEKVAEFLTKFGKENNLNQKSVFELNLILDEAITNVIQYGFEDDHIHNIEIKIQRNYNDIELQIIDDGKEFNPIDFKSADVETTLKDKPVGGLGIFFIKQKADNLIYKRISGRNILSITKKINTDGDLNEN